VKPAIGDPILRVKLAKGMGHNSYGEIAWPRCCRGVAVNEGQRCLVPVYIDGLSFIRSAIVAGRRRDPSMGPSRRLGPSEGSIRTPATSSERSQSYNRNPFLKYVFYPAGLRVGPWENGVANPQKNTRKSGVNSRKCPCLYRFYGKHDVYLPLYLLYIFLAMYLPSTSPRANFQDLNPPPPIPSRHFLTLQP